jgi:hypothetical protein
LDKMIRRAWTYVRALVSKTSGMQVAITAAFSCFVCSIPNALYFLALILGSTYGLEIDMQVSVYGFGIWAATAILFYACFQWLTRIEAKSDKAV